MDSEQAQVISERDQLWASLRGLHPEIERLARGNFDGGDLQKLVIEVLARIIIAEMEFRKRDEASS
ncbi:MAG: hypothetical protein K8T89_20130 [Planctomycetes bacterium]|nr:hypothetical protein [Planctomycetota bacterium]